MSEKLLKKAASRIADLGVELEIDLSVTADLQEMIKMVVKGPTTPFMLLLGEVAVRAYAMGRDSQHQCDICGSKICLPVKP